MSGWSRCRSGIFDADSYCVYNTEFRTSCKGESVHLCACNRQGDDHRAAAKLAGMSPNTLSRAKIAKSNIDNSLAYCAE